MTTIVHEADATLDPIRNARVAVVGYGNQGRSWALNLRDSGFDVTRLRARRRRPREQADRRRLRARSSSRPRPTPTSCASSSPTT